MVNKYVTTKKDERKRRNDSIQLCNPNHSVFLPFIAVSLFVCFLFILGYSYTPIHDISSAYLPASDSFMDLYYSYMYNGYYICPYWSGRLGNVMFEYASLYSIAKQYKMRLAITKNDRIYKTFNIQQFVHPVTENFKSDICKKYKKLELKRPGYFENVTMPVSQNVKIIGYLQSWKYFQNSEAELREQFIFKSDIIKTAETTFRDALVKLLGRQSNPDYISVGVHIRRGDFVTSHLTVANTNYLKEARHYYKKLYKKVVFIVCTSPDIESRKWAMDNFVQKYNNESILIKIQQAEVDMKLLSMCNHTIITVGSYSWWVGWLNNGTTIHYDYMTDNGRFRRQDYIPPGWIGIKT